MKIPWANRLLGLTAAAMATASAMSLVQTWRLLATPVDGSIIPAINTAVPEPFADELIRNAVAVASKRNIFVLGSITSATASDDIEQPAEPDADAMPSGGETAFADLILTGTIGGPPWYALIELGSEPGKGLLTAVGDTVGGWEVLAVQSDSAVIQAGDSIRTLMIRAPWR